jgi:hypothetical protein
MHGKKTTRFFAFLVICLDMAGCATPVPDPTAVGWNLCWTQDPSGQDKAIRDDYNGYIQKLPSEERYYAGAASIWFLENKAGQHAVKIVIPLNGTWREHVLIYGANDKRIRVIKRNDGRYAS